MAQIPHMNENTISWQSTGKDYSVTIVRQKNGDCSSCSSSSAEYTDLEDEFEGGETRSLQLSRAIVTSMELDQTITETVINHVMQESWSLSTAHNSQNILIERPQTRTIESSVDLPTEMVQKKQVVDDASDCTVQWILNNELQKVEQNSESESSSVFLLSSKSLSTRYQDEQTRHRKDFHTNLRSENMESAFTSISRARSLTTLTHDTSSNRCSYSPTPAEIFLSKLGGSRQRKQFGRSRQQSGSFSLDEPVSATPKINENAKANLHSQLESDFPVLNVHAKEAVSIIPVISVSYPQFINEILSNKPSDKNDVSLPPDVNTDEDTLEKTNELIDQSSRASSTAESVFSNTDPSLAGKNRNASKRKLLSNLEPPFEVKVSNSPSTSTQVSQRSSISENIFTDLDPSGTKNNRKEPQRRHRSDSPSAYNDVENAVEMKVEHSSTRKDIVSQSSISEDIFTDLEASYAKNNRKQVLRRHRPDSPSASNDVENSVEMKVEDSSTRKDILSRSSISEDIFTDLEASHAKNNRKEGLRRHRPDSPSAYNDVENVVEIKVADSSARKDIVSRSSISDDLEASYAKSGRNAAQWKHRSDPSTTSNHVESTVEVKKKDSSAREDTVSESSISEDVFSSYAINSRKEALRRHHPDPFTTSNHLNNPVEMNVKYTSTQKDVQLQTSPVPENLFTELEPTKKWKKGKEKDGIELPNNTEISLKVKGEASHAGSLSESTFLFPLSTLKQYRKTSSPDHGRLIQPPTASRGKYSSVEMNKNVSDERCYNSYLDFTLNSSHAETSLMDSTSDAIRKDSVPRTDYPSLSVFPPDRNIVQRNYSPYYHTSPSNDEYARFDQKPSFTLNNDNPPLVSSGVKLFSTENKQNLRQLNYGQRTNVYMDVSPKKIQTSGSRNNYSVLSGQTLANLEQSSSGNSKLSGARSKEILNPSNSSINKASDKDANTKGVPSRDYSHLTHYRSVEEVLQKFSKSTSERNYREEEYKENVIFASPPIKQESPHISSVKDKSKSLKMHQRDEQNSLKVLDRKVDTPMKMVQTKQHEKSSRKQPLVANHQVFTKSIDDDLDNYMDTECVKQRKKMDEHGCYYCARNCSLLTRDNRCYDREFTSINGKHSRMVERSRSRERIMHKKTGSRSQYTSPSRSVRESHGYEDSCENCSICGIKLTMTGSNGVDAFPYLEEDIRIHADYIVAKYLESPNLDHFMYYPLK